MNDKNIEDIVKGELRDDETLLWAGQSSLFALHLKTLIIFLIFATPFFAFFLFIFLLGEPDPDFNLMTSMLGATIPVAIIGWYFWKPFFSNKALSNKIYAATSQYLLVVVIRENQDVRSLERISYNDIKKVHRMRIAGAESITLVFKKSLIPNSKSLIIDGLEKNTPFYNIVKQKIS